MGEAKILFSILSFVIVIPHGSSTRTHTLGLNDLQTESSLKCEQRNSLQRLPSSVQAQAKLNKIRNKAKEMTTHVFTGGEFTLL